MILNTIDETQLEFLTISVLLILPLIAYLFIIKRFHGKEREMSKSVLTSINKGINGSISNSRLITQLRILFVIYFLIIILGVKSFYSLFGVDYILIFVQAIVAFCSAILFYTLVLELYEPNQTVFGTLKFLYKVIIHIIKYIFIFFILIVFLSFILQLFILMINVIFLHYEIDISKMNLSFFASVNSVFSFMFFFTIGVLYMITRCSFIGELEFNIKFRAI